MKFDDDYQQYAEVALQNFANINEERRYWLVESVGNNQVERILDVGCGAGYDLLQFIERKNAIGFGIDIAEKVGEIGKEFFETTNFADKVNFVCSRGEELPFANESFDVILCMVALPYMNNKKTIAEISRVLRPNGIFLLKIHAPKFYFQMLRERFKAGNLKSLIYPLIALFTGSFYWLTGNQLEGEILKGKEMFQTEKMIRSELHAQGLKIKEYLQSNNDETPAYLIVKV